MKLLGIRFKNLNSLYDEWEIDFTAPAYINDGIFAITGPTGAGKSTLLDAICLALFGRTPRLKIISKTVNEVMSRQTGECFSELTFETFKGTYRCHWSQRRARSRPGGNLQDTRHEISDAVTGQVIESKKREVAAVVEKVTGMDFDRFTRSMLLAQGGFAAFLSASQDERAPILEQITGTRIYSDISKQVHERFKEEQSLLKLMEAAIGDITLLSCTEKKERLSDLEAKKEEQTRCHKKSDEVSVLLQWRTAVDTLTQELADLKIEEQTLQKAVNQFKPDRERLEKAVAAARIEPEYIHLKTLRVKQTIDEKKLSEILIQLPEQQKKCSQGQKELDQAKEQFINAKQNYRKELEHLKKVRAMDLQITEKKQVLSGLEKEIQKTEQQLGVTKSKLEASKDSHEKACRQKERIKEYLFENSADETLITQLAKIKEQVKRFEETQEKEKKLSEKMLKAREQLGRLSDQYGACLKTCKEKSKGCEKAKEKTRQLKKQMDDFLTGRLLREYRTEYEHGLKEMAFLKKIEQLEEQRKHLEDGKPCPLCGAVSHPFSENREPKADKAQKKLDDLSEFILKAEKIETKIAKAEKNQYQAETDFVQTEKTLEKELGALERQKEKLEWLAREKQARSSDILEQKAQLDRIFSGYGIDKNGKRQPGKAVRELEKRQQAFLDFQEKQRGVEKEIQTFFSQVKGYSGVLETLAQTHQQHQRRLEKQGEEKEILVEKRKKFYGNKDPDEQETKLETRLSESEKKVPVLQNHLDGLKSVLSELNHSLAALKENISSRSTELETCGDKFAGLLDEAGFKTKDLFEKALLGKAQRDRLNREARRLENQAIDIKARKEDRQGRLSQLTAQDKTGEKYENLSRELEKFKKQSRVLAEEIGALKQQLQDDETARQEFEKKTDQLQAQKKEWEKWLALHELIGSADGKKFRNFAQGITFDLMVGHANQQLEKMNDRYLLVRDGQLPLELNILDNYQAGEVRSTKNLSGGESFIVSLCLALGLSSMAGRNVRVDSLFLDEGFGTLDETAMETALDTLARLQQEGKLVGIISHVSAIKERIPSRITVSAQPGGKSVISGPGCRRV